MFTHLALTALLSLTCQSREGTYPFYDLSYDQGELVILVNKVFAIERYRYRPVEDGDYLLFEDGMFHMSEDRSVGDLMFETEWGQYSAVLVCD